MILLKTSKKIINIKNSRVIFISGRRKEYQSIGTQTSAEDILPSQCCSTIDTDNTEEDNDDHDSIQNNDRSKCSSRHPAESASFLAGVRHIGNCL